MGEERRRDQVRRQLGGKKDKGGGKMNLMGCVRLTFSVLQKKKNGVFGDDEFLQLHHVWHRGRHDCPLRPPTVTALPQALRGEDRGRGGE